MDYWKECVEAAFEDEGITATETQKENIAGAIEVAHENYGMCFGHDCIPNHQEVELEKAKKELEFERGKITCGECGGSGRIIANGPYHGSNSECFKCRGEGKYNPHASPR